MSWDTATGQFPTTSPPLFPSNYHRNNSRKRPAPKKDMPPAVKLDDLYRLAMPKLFQLAEREGITEHTGMNRAQLIVGIVRKQIERGQSLHLITRVRSTPACNSPKVTAERKT